MNPTARKVLLVLTAAAAVLSATGCAAERLSPNEFDQVAPASNGNDVVWEDSRNDPAGNGTDIYRYDVGTNTERARRTTNVVGRNRPKDNYGCRIRVCSINEDLRKMEYETQILSE